MQDLVGQRKIRRYNLDMQNKRKKILIGSFFLCLGFIIAQILYVYAHPSLSEIHYRNLKTYEEPTIFVTPSPQGYLSPTKLSALADIYQFNYVANQQVSNINQLREMWFEFYPGYEELTYDGIVISDEEVQHYYDQQKIFTQMDGQVPYETTIMDYASLKGKYIDIYAYRFRISGIYHAMLNLETDAYHQAANHYKTNYQNKIYALKESKYSDYILAEKYNKVMYSLDSKSGYSISLIGGWGYPDRDVYYGSELKSYGVDHNYLLGQIILDDHGILCDIDINPNDSFAVTSGREIYVTPSALRIEKGIYDYVSDKIYDDTKPYDYYRQINYFPSLTPFASIQIYDKETRRAHIIDDLVLGGVILDPNYPVASEAPLAFLASPEIIAEIQAITQPQDVLVDYESVENPKDLLFDLVSNKSQLFYPTSEHVEQSMFQPKADFTYLFNVLTVCFIGYAEYNFYFILQRRKKKKKKHNNELFMSNEEASDDVVPVHPITIKTFLIPLLISTLLATLISVLFITYSENLFINKVTGINYITSYYPFTFGLFSTIISIVGVLLVNLPILQEVSTNKTK